MKLTKSQLKELIRHAIVQEIKIPFSSSHIKQLKRAFKDMKGTLPDNNPLVQQIVTLLKKTDKKVLKQIANADIKYLSDKAKDILGEGKITESKKRRYTVKEVRMWMKKLEENRYKKVYNSDARRVAWMVNNEGRTLDEMPISMKKKWSKAQYGRERYLATEFLKSKSEQLSEGLDLKKLETAIKDFQKKIKKQGRVTNARDEDHLEQLIKVYKQMGGKKIKEQKLRESIREIIEEQMNEKINLGGAYEKMILKHNDKIAQNALSLVRNKIMKDYKVGKKSPKSSETVTRRLVATLINNGMKEIRNKAKSPSLKKAFQKIIDIREKNLKKMKEGKLKEAYRSQSIFFDKKDKSKLEKLLKKNKGKFPFNPPGEPVVNWSITNQGSKGLEWRGIPKSKYDKAVEFFMKNKLNPRG